VLQYGWEKTWGRYDPGGSEHISPDHSVSSCGCNDERPRHAGGFSYSTFTKNHERVADHVAIERT